MPAAQYTFTGYVTTGYPDYRDLGTDRTLVADPGKSYGISAVDGALGVPPGDGHWAVAEDSGYGGWEPPPPPPSVPEVPEVPAMPEGGDTE